jgi:outer membrane protein OmpA-like peptidoglycan-associated protein
MLKVRLTSLTLLGMIAATSTVLAQDEPPPPPPPVDQPPPVQPGAPGTPDAQQPPPFAPPGDPAQPTDPGTEAQGQFEVSAGTDDGLEATGDATVPPGTDSEYRLRSLTIQNSLQATTGLLHLSEASSGAPGTFRVSFWGSWFNSSGFLCNAESICPSLRGEPETAEDESERVGAHFGISATLLPFLEAFIGLHNTASSDNRGRPQLLQILGDTNLGLKGFLPWQPDQMFSFGGQVQLMLLNGTGSVGLDGGGTSFGLKGLVSGDFNNRTNPEERVPLRLHMNLGYLFDNSGNIVDDIESREPPEGRGGRITRIERFGLDINRVDSFQIGLGAEFVHEVIRPFVEWNIDIPVNRQEHTCNINSAEDAGDLCLGDNAGFSTTPSRLTFGARVFPWEKHGLSLMAAVDIGTGATSSFIEEVAPEPPWTLYFGLAYAIDTKEPEPIIQRVEAPPPPPAPAAPPAFYLSGRVIEKGTGTPIKGAIVAFEGRDLTGMVSNDEGRFRSADLEPGTYTLKVTAPGYREGQCSATIQAGAAAPPPQQPGYTAPAYGQDPSQPGFGAPPAAAAQGGPVQVDCELEALPKVGNIVGSVVDADTGTTIAGASVKITDKLGRELELTGDSGGAFRFENVPPGPAKITVNAPGYLTSVAEFEIKPQDELRARMSLNKRPAQPNVVVTVKELKLKKQVHFQHNSADILPDSMGILEELADVLKSRGEIKRVEVQGHTDNTGTPEYNQRLSQQRAQAVVDALVRLGVDSSRLEAKGYGQDRPLAPNTTDANRAKNRRVQVIITERNK